MVVSSRLKMDLLAPGVPLRLSAVQSDEYSRNLEIELYSGGSVWEPPEGVSVLVCYKKSDGTGGNYDALPDGTPAATVAGNLATVALAPQVLTVPGSVELVVGFVSGETKLHTFVVHLDVQPNPGLRATSDNYYNIVGSVTFTPSVTDDGWLKWSNNGGLPNPDPVLVKGDPGATPQQVLDAMPAVTALDFTDFKNGSFTETVDGVVSKHTVAFDDSGRPSKIDDIVITWGV